MSAIYPAPTRLRPQEMRPVVYPSGTAALLLDGSAFIGFDSPLEARLLAVRLLELANAVEAAQRKETVA